MTRGTDNKQGKSTGPGGLQEKLGNSCTESELWNSLTAPRPVASSVFSIGPAFGFEKNMTSEEVKNLIEADPDLNPAEKQKILKNLLTVRLANNRRVDVTLSTTGEQSVRRFPFSAKDALTLLSRGGGETPKKKTAAPAPPKKAKP